jgi:hypothetical protein
MKNLLFWLSLPLVVIGLGVVGTAALIDSFRPFLPKWHEETTVEEIWGACVGFGIAQLLIGFHVIAAGASWGYWVIFGPTLFWTTIMTVIVVGYVARQEIKKKR